MITRTALPSFGSAPAGLAFYDANNAYVSGLGTTVPAGGTFTCPSGAAGFQATVAAVDVPNLDIEFGSVLAATYQSPYTYAGNVIDSKITAGQAQTSALDLGYLNSLFSAPPNLFDSTKITANTLLHTGVGNTCGTTETQSSSIGWFTSAAFRVLPNVTYTMRLADNDTNPSYGLVWLDANGNCTGTSVGFPFTAGQNFTSPGTAFFARFSGQNGLLSTQMFTAGTTAPAAYYAAPVLQTAASTEASVSPLNGLGWMNWGDSISSIFSNKWQTVVTAQTGLNFIAQDARPGRTIGGIFECYGAQTLGGTLSTYNSTNTWPASSVSGTCASYGNFGLTNGNTLAQNLANVRLLTIALGTNDTGDAIGSPGDAVSANSVWGNVSFAETTLHTANPQMRVVWITNEFNGTATSASSLLATTLCTIVATFGDGCVNLYGMGGANAANASTTVRTDATHPSDYNFLNLYGPIVSSGLLRMF